MRVTKFVTSNEGEDEETGVIRVPAGAAWPFEQTESFPRYIAYGPFWAERVTRDDFKDLTAGIRGVVVSEQ